MFNVIGDYFDSEIRGWGGDIDADGNGEHDERVPGTEMLVGKEEEDE